MILTSTSFADEEPIPETFAFAKPDPENHFAFAGNRNPHLEWSGAPEACKSFALICVDPDVPSVGDDVNQEGRTISSDLPRTDFHHWVVVDLPASCTRIDEGECSDGVTAGGKQSPPNPIAAPAARQGVTDYTTWFAGDPDMGGTYYGYDGPAPPWNDELVHRYQFKLYALDVTRVGVEGEFTGDDVMRAIGGHVVAEATLIGTYTMNPALRSG